MGKTVVRQASEGDALWVLGGLYEIKVAGEDTGDAVTIMQMTVPEGAGPPPHTHAGDETVYVLEGRARFHSGEETFEAGPGTLIHFPSGTLETFEPLGTASVLITYTPGGIDRFFRDIGEPAARREVPPPMESPPDLAAIAAAGERYGMQIQMPPG